MKLIVAATTLLTVLTTAHSASAETEPSEETVAVAAEANVDPVLLAGAVNSTGLPAREYMAAVHELATPGAVANGAVEAGDRDPAVPGWPIGGALGQRLYCIENIESHHGIAMWNPTPVWNGEHAQGWMGFLPSTARAWGVVIGNRASEWAGAARMLQAGAGRQFAGVAWGRC